MRSFASVLVLAPAALANAAECNLATDFNLDLATRCITSWGPDVNAIPANVDAHDALLAEACAFSHCNTFFKSWHSLSCTVNGVPVSSKAHFCDSLTSGLTPPATSGAAPKASWLEFHYHTYFNHTDPVEIDKAQALRDALVANIRAKDRSFVAVPLHLYKDNSFEEYPQVGEHYGLNLGPIGPHPDGSFETWVPIESFVDAYEWFVANRQGLTIFIHPLTQYELIDHTERAVFVGKSAKLNVDDWSSDPDPSITSEYPQFKLGYSAPNQSPVQPANLALSPLDNLRLSTQVYTVAMLAAVVVCGIVVARAFSRKQYAPMRSGDKSPLFT
ncbi:Aste57867_21810 [Aphanomyces stellatus]|uniref:Aste57867_21810 protein n=1 Tax=Aphanomyces stellatus TaxID=120398 RepID=A0A485LJR4_9STRA|nr:hypothetical protein As57867_021741 [Aphanomyces stellatus]VFT98479.1 Aste57867_21810 [Aphanomyces stellatus]